MDNKVSAPFSEVSSDLIERSMSHIMCGLMTRFFPGGRSSPGPHCHRKEAQ